MLEAFRSQVARILGQPEDPLGLITPEQLKAVLKSIEGKYNTLRDENKRLKATLAETREHLERTEADLVEARRQPEDPDQDPRVLEVRAQAAEAVARAEAAEAEKTQLEAELERTRLELELGREATEQVRQELDRAMDEIAAAQAQLDQLKAELDGEREDHDRTKHSLEGMRQELVEARSSEETWKRELHELRADSTRLLDEASSAGLTLEAAQAEIAELRGALEAALLKAGESDQCIAQLEREVEGLSTRAVSPFTHSALQTERDTLRSELLTAQTRLREEQAAMEALREELDRSRHSTQVIATATDLKVQERVSSLEHEKQDLRHQLEAAYLEIDRLRKELHGVVGSAFRPGAAPAAGPAAPRLPASAEDRRKMLAQLIRGQDS